jgi:hypothetical protein
MLFSFKQLLFHNGTLYKAENVCFCGGLQFQDLNAQKHPATRRLLSFKIQYFKRLRNAADASDIARVMITSPPSTIGTTTTM